MRAQDPVDPPPSQGLSQPVLATSENGQIPEPGKHQVMSRIEIRGAAFGPDLPYLEALGRQLRVVVDALLFVGRALAAPSSPSLMTPLAESSERPAGREPEKRDHEYGVRPPVAESV